MNITTTGKKRYMSYEFKIKQPMQTVKLNVNMILDGNPYLINSLDRSFNHPLIRKNCSIPFN